MLYLKCLKALYGHIEVARLFYKDYLLTEQMRFEKKKHDPCVYNMRTEEGLTTIRTHVGDLKESLKLRDQLNVVIEELKEIYQDITVHVEDKYDYLGMIMPHD